MEEEKNGTIEIRFHGRGGQGVVTAAKFLAEAALKEGKCFQAMPDYGGERMGAPIRAYTRISKKPIIPHCLVTEPNIVVVVDPTLLTSIDIKAGLKKDGIIVINTPLSPAEMRKKLDYKEGKVVTVDATQIALRTLGRNIPNVPILGALVKATPIVEKQALLSIVKEKLGALMKATVVEANIKAYEQAYNECQIG